MCIVLIGAEGQLGRDLRRRLSDDVVALDLPAFDACDPRQVAEVMHQSRPRCVVNCAAVTNVDACEQQPQAAWRVNAQAAGQVARCAADVGARVVFISTDYVFATPADGKASRERDLPQPLNIYGVTKLAGEYLTAANNPDHLIVRTSGLYGHGGARGKGGNFVETIRRLAGAGEPLRIVDDQRLSPTSTAALAERLVDLLDNPATGVLHLAAADSCTWYELACAIVASAGAAVEVTPISSAELGRPARRPPCSALASDRLAEVGLAPLPPWRAMLEDYLSAASAS